MGIIIKKPNQNFMATVKKPWYKTENVLFLLVPIIIIVGVFIFLFNKDGGISGEQALAQQGNAFWVWVVLGAAAGIYLIYRALTLEKEGSEKTGRMILFIVLGVLLLFSPWAKACTDKANGGIKTIQVP